MYEKFVIELYNSKFKTLEDFVLNKKRIFGQEKIDPPSNAEILKIYNALLNKKILNKYDLFEKYCKKHKIRTLSGVSVISILTKETPCPGNCAFCPTEKDMPKSYLSNEPAVMRAIKCNFDAYGQVTSRLLALNNTGHDTSKNEIIIMGGTWSYHDKNYQEEYILDVFKALNTENIKFKIQNSKTILNILFLKIKEKFTKNNLDKIDIEQEINEISKNRCVGLTLETRQDYVDEKELKRMRRFGCTRIEIGVQSIFDDVLKLNRRGHDVDASIKATKLMKDAGFKICYHIMPNLPGSNLEKDYEMFYELYNNPNFKPDMLKIYPCVVIETADIYNWFKEGKYISYTDDELINLLIKIKSITPPWIRINRLIRDIPSTSIIAGNKIPNLREVVQKQMQKENLKCNCIRCREIKDKEYGFDDIEMFVEKYEASGGHEYFISFEDKMRKNIFSFLRLRIPSNYFENKKHFIEELNNCAIIREVHTYGIVASVGENKEEYDRSQHHGFGKKLMQEAEKIIKENYKIKKLAVIAGVGVREYYRNNGFKKVGTYMIKDII